MIVFVVWMMLSMAIPQQDSRDVDTAGTNTHFAPPSVSTREAWDKRKIVLRKQILSAAGLYPIPNRTPLNPRVFGRVVNRDCTIEKVLLETMPGYYLGGNLYRPLRNSGRGPAVLIPHGHWVYGRLENQPLYSGPALGINLARQGYVVFEWDMVGFNDTIQTPHAFGNPAEQLWSFGPFGLQLWNSMRALDFVAALDDVDPMRIGMTGASGGATQTIMLAAVDDRIRAAAPVNMVSLIMQGGDFCENAPGLRLGTNNVEIAALFAPKPMLLVSATGDWTRNTPLEEYPAIRRIYKLYGKEDNVETLQLDAPHNFNKENREAVYRFFGKQLLHDPDAAKFSEKGIQAEMLQNMLVLAGRGLPDGALSYEQVFKAWRKMTFPETDARERLRLAMAVEWPEQVVSESDGPRVVLSRAGVGDRVEGNFRDGKGTPLLIVGSYSGRVAPGQPVLSIQSTVPAAAAPSIPHFLTFHRSDDARRAQDVLTALAWLHQRQGGTIDVAVIAPKAVYAGFAAAVSPIPVHVVGGLENFGGTDEDFLQSFDVPGIQRAGGVAAARQLLSP